MSGTTDEGDGSGASSFAWHAALHAPGAEDSDSSSTGAPPSADEAAAALDSDDDDGAPRRRAPRPLDEMLSIAREGDDADLRRMAEELAHRGEQEPEAAEKRAEPWNGAATLEPSKWAGFARCAPTIDHNNFRVTRAYIGKRRVRQDMVDALAAGRLRVGDCLVCLRPQAAAEKRAEIAYARIMPGGFVSYSEVTDTKNRRHFASFATHDTMATAERQSGECDASLFYVRMSHRFATVPDWVRSVLKPARGTAPATPWVADDEAAVDNDYADFVFTCTYDELRAFAEDKLEAPPRAGEPGAAHRWTHAALRLGESLTLGAANLGGTLRLAAVRAVGLLPASASGYAPREASAPYVFALRAGEQRQNKVTPSRLTWHCDLVEDKHDVDADFDGPVPAAVGDMVARGRRFLPEPDAAPARKKPAPPRPAPAASAGSGARNTARAIYDKVHADDSDDDTISDSDSDEDERAYSDDSDEDMDLAAEDDYDDEARDDYGDEDEDDDEHAQTNGVHAAAPEPPRKRAKTQPPAENGARAAKRKRAPGATAVAVRTGGLVESMAHVYKQALADNAEFAEFAWSLKSAGDTSPEAFMQVLARATPQQQRFVPFAVLAFASAAVDAPPEPRGGKFGAFFASAF